MSVNFLKDKSTIIGELYEKRAKIDDNCLIWLGCTQNEYGVVNLRVVSNGEVKWKRFYAHRIVYMIEKNTVLAENVQISHLCHEKLCQNINHLNAESSIINMQRETCLMHGYCTGHDDNPKCLFYTN